MASAASGTSAASEASADSGSGSKSDEVYEITDLPADDAGAAAKARSVGFSLTDAGAGVEADAGIDSTPLVLSIVLDFLDEVLDSLEVARLSEMGLITISKTLHTAHSESFWRELAALSFSLFSHHAYRSAFCLLGALCKQCWLPIRTRVAGKGAVGAGAAGGKGGAGKGGAVGGRVGGEADSRDVGAKLSALSALEEFLLKSGECLTQSKIFGYQVRRIVVPCLLYNVAFAFLDSRVFAKLLRVVTALWRRWRTHCRIEFAILCEQFVFRVMQANAVQTRAVEKLLLIQEVVRWFEQPHLLLEMFVNYDMDRKFVSHWNTFSYLVRTLCSIGKRLVFSLAEDQETPPPTPTYGSTSTSYTSGEVKVLGVREVHLQALTEVARIAKTLMDASGHAYLILQDSGFRNKSLMGGGGWVEDEETTSLKGAVKAAGLQAAAMAMSAASSAASSATASASPTPTASAAPTPVGMTHFFATPVGTTPFFPASNPATPTAASDATDATTPVDAAVDADSTASATASASASAATTPTTAAPSPDKYDSNTVSNTVSNTNATDLGYIYAAEPPAPVLPTPTPTPTTAPTAPTTTVADAADTPTSASVRHSPKKRREGSIKMRRRAHEEAEQLISEAIKIYAAKQDMKKAVKYLVNKGFMDDTPQEVANFLRVYKNSFDPGAIGDFLGEGGINAAEEEYWSQIRFRYTRAVSFVEMDVEPALRLYLTGCGFRLPGEAQKINRYVEAFVQAFWQVCNQL
ncbi:hypothetical protein B484DRAFT_114680 [Ochromonadaceae sp. CCMP2298]|nr:hypothetical protein B484DRAFT_114680 [Ochromonadaceae sp. CCMP2298]